MKLKKRLSHKALLLVTFLLAAACVLVAQITVAAPKPQTEQSVVPQVQPTSEDSPCYFQTQNGSTIDLARLCGATVTPSPARSIAPTQSTAIRKQSYPQPPKVYDYGRMKAFDDSLYGTRNSVDGHE
jgi:hypothetical protein